MKHKHADLIHAWADGAEIQKRYADGSWLDDDPLWLIEHEYRIKPEEKKPVVRWLWAYKDGLIDNAMMTDEECAEARKSATSVKAGIFKLEWSRTEFPE